MFFHGFGLARVTCLLCLILALAFFHLCIPLRSQSCASAEPKPGVSRAAPNSALSILPPGLPPRL